MASHYRVFQNTYRLVFECESEEPDDEVRITVTRPEVAVTIFPNRRLAP